MYKKSTLFFITLMIVVLAILGTYGLVADEYTNGNICPKILGIPACYIVMICFFIACIAHILSHRYAYILYFISVSIVTSIASYGTIGEIFGFANCPKTEHGIPMCFISFGICLMLLITKSIDVTYASKT